MATQGPNYPASGTSVSSGDANEVAWTNPGSITADDATEAQITAATFDSPDPSFYLVASDFGFTIPAGSTIDGITVEIDRRSIIASSGIDVEVMLRDDTASIVGANKASATVWPSTSAVATYGGAADTWTASPTETMVNSPNFGVVLQARANIANADIGVDFIRITVNYTPVVPVDKTASDSATAADVVTHTASMTGDEASVSDDVSAMTALLAADETGSGADVSVLTALTVATDSGTGADASLVSVPLVATESGTAVDTASLDTGAPPATAEITSPLPLLVQAITASTVSPVLDSFDRADGAIGVSDSGHTWLAQSGTWSISSNRAYRSTAEGQSTVVVDSGMTSIALSVDVTFAVNPDSGVIFGGIDDNNYLLFSFSGSGTSLILWKRDASIFTLLSSYTVASYASTTKAIRVEWFANSGLIGLWLGGLLIGTVTLSSGDRTKYAPGTRQGLREHTTAGDRTFFDNYSASLPTEWATATASNSLPVLSTLTTVRHANTTDWSNEASDTTEVGAGTQVIVVTVGV